MRIAVKGRNVSVTDAHREQVQRRFRRIARQVSVLAELEVELHEERNPAIADRHVVEATLALKGVTLRARAAAADMSHAINCCEEQLRKQVERHRARRRNRRATRAAQAQAGLSPAQL